MRVILTDYGFSLAPENDYERFWTRDVKEHVWRLAEKSSDRASTGVSLTVGPLEDTSDPIEKDFLHVEFNPEVMQIE